MFGNTEVWVGVVEWGGLADLTVLCSPTDERLRANLRDSIVESIESIAADARSSDMSETLRKALSSMPDEDFFLDLNERSVDPWVTIERHVLAINPVSA